jgi:hypothetical protein
MKTLFKRISSLVFFFRPHSFPDAPPPTVPFADRLKNDRISLQIYRRHLSSIVGYFRHRPYPAHQVLTGFQKEDLRGTWRSFLDNLMALDSIGHYYASFNDPQDPETTRRAFWTADWIFLTEYRYALEFLKELDQIPGADVFLNETGEDRTLSKNSLADFKFRFLNVERAAEFLLRDAQLDSLGPVGRGSPEGRQIKEDRKVVLSMGMAPGPLMTVKNGARILAQSAFETCFPVQRGLSEWMGRTKVYRQGQCLISPVQAEQLEQRLEPGDILFSRHEWYISNVGLPGFWCHAALYIGDAATRKAYFDDPQVKAWMESQGVQGGLDDLLKSKFRAKYASSLKTGPQGQIPRVIEAVGEGVIFSHLGRFAEADSLCAIRPRLSKVEKAIALFRAFRYVGRPYDFNFDFQSDDTLVCSEMVYKAYEPSPGRPGMKFSIQQMMGHTVCAPNGMVEQFDGQYGTPAQQSDFVVFLDGREKEKDAVEASLQEFRESWKRPKWHVLVQK